MENWGLSQVTLALCFLTPKILSMISLRTRNHIGGTSLEVLCSHWLLPPMLNGAAFPSIYPELETRS